MLNHHNTDSRLIKAYKLIQADKLELLSIDLFDTLIWRKMPLPIDLFLILGRRLKADGWLIDAVSAEGFPALRMAAEQIAKQKKLQNSNNQSNEITLDEIYWELTGIISKITIEEMVEGKKGIINETDIRELVSFEVNLEEEMLGLDANMAALIQFANDKKIKVVLVSDTYFEMNYIQQYLKKCQFDASLISKIYLSCDAGVGKRRGLFPIVLAEAKVDPRKVLHIGDNYLSDYIAAKKEKIRTIFYEKYDRELANILENEWSTDEQVRASHLDDTQGDFGLSAMRSRLCHHTDLNKLNEKEQQLWRYGATVFAPFITGFVSWIYKRCQEMKETQVLCLMREGRLYAQMIKEIASWYPGYPLDAQELWVSRRFLSQACILHCSKDELLALLNIHPITPYTLSSFCKLLGIEIEKMGSLKKDAHVDLKEISHVDRVIHFIQNDELLCKEIIHNSALKRQRFLKYLATIVNLNTCTNLILVDLGWTGNLQGTLERILYYSGYKITVHGLYMGTAMRANYSLLQGHIREGFLLKVGYPIGATKAIARGIYVLEQTATSICNTGSLQDIDAEGNIITGEMLVSQDQVAEAQVIVTGIKAYIHEIGKYIQRKAIHNLEKSEAFQNQLRAILLRATSLPTKKEVKALTSWGHDHVSGHTKPSAMGDDRYYEKYIGNILPGVIYPEDWGITWPAAYAARYDEHFALAAQAIRLLKLPPKCFLSHDVLPLKIYADKGDGIGHRALKLVKMRSNASRKFYSHFKLISLTKPIQKIRFELDVLHAFVRINSIRLEIKTRETEEMHHLTFFESKNDHQIDCDNTEIEKLSFNTFLCKDQFLSFTHSFDDLKEIYQMKVLICCEKFSFN